MLMRRLLTPSILMALVTMSCDGVTGDFSGRAFKCVTDADCAKGNVCACKGVNGMQCMTELNKRLAELGDTTETCDGRDQDCDGTPDNGCTCAPDTTRTCGLDDPSRDGVGICRAGTQTCSGVKPELNKWSACEGAVTPTIETCNGTDDDCDGTTDEDVQNVCGGCENLPSLPDDPCTTVFPGECTLGHYVCDGTDRVICLSFNQPKDEMCNNLDDDCDGTTDEEVGNVCGGCSDLPANVGDVCTTDMPGRCRDGHFACEGDASVVCSRDRDPIDERCNGLDDDCDDEIDEVFGEKGDVCPAGEGECRREGIFVCTPDGFGVVCNAVPGNPAPTEDCTNRLDDDCDGTVNNGCACTVGDPDEVCGSDTGECVSGTQTCVGGVWSSCGGTFVGQTNEICNGLDDDCDDDTDEGLSGEGCCHPSDVRDCGTDVGFCNTGVEVCAGNFRFGSCGGVSRGNGRAYVAASDEVCDGQDNDCDGAVDNDVPDRLTIVAGAEAACNMDTRTCTGACRVGVEHCRLGSWIQDPNHVAQGPTAETCNSVDDDCDGHIDDDIGSCCTIGQTERCWTTNVGVCTVSDRTCEANPATGGGRWPDCDGDRRSDEQCNGEDDDCDGMTDEDFRPPRGNFGTACTVGRGICTNSGLFRCMANGFGTECSAEPLPSTPETCDNRDEDCDGNTDNGVTRPCYTGLPPETRNVGACQNGVNRCSGGMFGAVCEDQVTPAASEACNNEDDDCDGITDWQSEACYSGPAGTSGVGICHGGSRTCTGGVWNGCTGEVVPAASEACGNSLDDDCDGVTDEPAWTSFVDDFEVGELNARWAPAIRGGGTILLSSAQAHDGTRSVRTEAIMADGMNAQARLELDLPLCANSITVEVWMYLDTPTPLNGNQWLWVGFRYPAFRLVPYWVNGVFEYIFGDGSPSVTRVHQPTSSAWHRIVLQRVGTRFTFTYDGVSLLDVNEVEDPQRLVLGGQAVSADGTSLRAYFDQVRVTIE